MSQIYKEQLFDLLSGKERDQSQVDIREDARGIRVAGLTEVTVSTVTETISCLERVRRQAADRQAAWLISQSDSLSVRQAASQSASRPLHSVARCGFSANLIENPISEFELKITPNR